MDELKYVLSDDAVTVNEKLVNLGSDTKGDITAINYNAEVLELRVETLEENPAGVSSVNGVSPDVNGGVAVSQDDIFDGDTYVQYSAEDRDKLVGLESSKFKGVYATEALLTAAHPSPEEGSYAYVDAGAASVTYSYIWDSSNLMWQDNGETSTDTPATIKEKYESNSDTNAFDDAASAKLALIEDGANNYVAPEGTVVDALYVHTDNNYTDEDKIKLAVVDEDAEPNNVSDVDAAMLTGNAENTSHYHAKSTEDASLYNIAAITSTVPVIDASVYKNANCDIQLTGDLNLVLTNLSEVAVGVINIAAQTVPRTVSISGTTVEFNIIPVKADVGIEMSTSTDGKVSFTYLYDGVDLLINKGTTYVEMV